MEPLLYQRQRERERERERRKEGGREGEGGMSRNGVWQLKQLTLRYCPFSGSSRGVRTFVEGEMMEKFTRENAQLQMQTMERRGRHPFLEAVYGA